MDYRKIDNILNKYFEGMSTLEEEKLLRQYFASGDIAEAHEPYRSMFQYFENAQDVTNPLPVRLKENRRNYKKYYASFFFSGF